jgi:hypothetical protein
MGPMGGALTRSLVAGVLGALLVPAVAAANPAPFSLSRGVAVQPSGTTLRIDCPRGSTALAGAVTSRSTGVTVHDSFPTESERWVFRFSSLVGAADARARAAVRCLRLKPRRGTRHWKLSNTTGSRTVRIRPLATRRVRVRCLGGYLATGYGISRTGADPVGPLPSGDVRVAAAVPALRHFTFRLENPGGDTVRATASVRCLSRMANAKRNGATVVQRFAVARRAFSNRVRTGARRVVRHRCPSGHYSLAAGLSLRSADDIFSTAAHAAGARGGSWSFNHPAGGPQRVGTYLTCMSLRTGFD